MLKEPRATEVVFGSAGRPSYFDDKAILQLKQWAINQASTKPQPPTKQDVIDEMLKMTFRKHRKLPSVACCKKLLKAHPDVKFRKARKSDEKRRIALAEVDLEQWWRETFRIAKELGIRPECIINLDESGIRYDDVSGNRFFCMEREDIERVRQTALDRFNKEEEEKNNTSSKRTPLGSITNTQTASIPIENQQNNSQHQNEHLVQQQKNDKKRKQLIENNNKIEKDNSTKHWPKRSKVNKEEEEKENKLKMSNINFKNKKQPEYIQPFQKQHVTLISAINMTGRAAPPYLIIQSPKALENNIHLEVLRERSPLMNQVNFR